MEFLIHLKWATQTIHRSLEIGATLHVLLMTWPITDPIKIECVNKQPLKEVVVSSITSWLITKKKWRKQSHILRELFVSHTTHMHMTHTWTYLEWITQSTIAINHSELRVKPKNCWGLHWNCLVTKESTNDYQALSAVYSGGIPSFQGKSICYQIPKL